MSTIVVFQDHLDGGWVASCSNVPGCWSQGDTRELAIAHLLDAADAIADLTRWPAFVLFPRLDRAQRAATEARHRVLAAFDVLRYGAPEKEWD